MQHTAFRAIGEISIPEKKDLLGVNKSDRRS